MSQFPSMVDVVPPSSLGIAKVEHFEVSSSASRFSALRPGEFVPEGKYARLYVGGTMMMSDTMLEHRTNYEFVRRAHGRVLIAGLGLGMVVHPLFAKDRGERVTSVCVVEKHADVIALVQPTLPAAAGVTVVHADIHTWEPPLAERWNTIYFDIWPNLCTDNLDVMTRLHRRYRKHLDKSDGAAWMGSWGRELLRDRRRQERRAGW